MRLRKIYCITFLFVCSVLVVSGCKKAETTRGKELYVVTTLFPLYDFARAIAGNSAHVSMLLPPGVEPHTFEPRPEDMINISRAGLFIYTNKYMEPWAENIISGIGSKGLRVVNAGSLVAYQKDTDEDQHHHHHETSPMKEENHARAAMDPHVWLDLSNAALMAEAIVVGFATADPANSEIYRRNGDALKSRLALLDERYRKSLSNCVTKKILHGGHYTFGYLARRYGLEYHSLSGVSSDSEPSAARMTALVREINSSGVKYLFAEELLSPRLTETLAQEAGVSVVMLHGAHNLSRDEMTKNVSFFDLMERNLVQLQKGLQCR